MDDSQADNGPALSAEQLNDVLADESKQSDAKPKAEQPEADAETETAAEGSEAEGTTEEKPEAEASEADKGSEEEDKPKRLSGSERLKRQNAALKAELDALRSRQGDGAPSKEAIEKLIGDPPKEEDFKGDFLAFERAQTAYELDRRIATRELKQRAETAQNSRQEAIRELVEAHEERIEEFAAKVPDFKKTLQAASHLKASPTVEELILESDKSAHLVYHLAKNPDRLERLNKMSEREAAREIGRIESRLSLPNPKTQTTALKPVTPLKGGAAPSSPDRELDAWLSKKYGKQN